LLNFERIRLHPRRIPLVIAATFLNILFVPCFYVVTQEIYASLLTLLRTPSPEYKTSCNYSGPFYKIRNFKF
jgi:hypothetical protein